MSGGFAFGGNNSGGQQFRSVMPGIPSMQTSSQQIAQTPLTGGGINFNRGLPPQQGSMPLTGNFQPNFGQMAQPNMQGQVPLTGNFQPSFMNQSPIQPTPINRNLNYGPQAVNEPTSTPVPYSPPSRAPLTGNFQPRFPSTVARGYR